MRIPSHFLSVDTHRHQSALYLATPRVRFQAETVPFPKSSQLPPKPGWFDVTMARLLAYVYSRPRLRIFIEAHLMGRPERLMDWEHLHLYKPVHLVDFRSADGTKLKGYWLPATQTSERSQKTILMGHGYSADFRELLGLVPPLREAGYNVFMFDFRAHGRSHGDFSSMGYHEGRDIGGAVQWLHQEQPDKAQKIAYLGHSMGAAAYLLLPHSLQDYPVQLKLTQDKVAAAVLDSPYADLSEMAPVFIRRMAHYSPNSKPLALLVRFIGRRMDAIVHSLMSVATGYLQLGIPFTEMKPVERYLDRQPGTEPIMIVHGEKDRVTPLAHSVTIFNRLKNHNPQAEFLTLPDAGHFDSNWAPVTNGHGYVSAMRAPDHLVPNVLRFLDTALSKK